MEISKYFFYNDKIVQHDQAVISINNRSFRYGDGFFETIRFVNNEIALKQYHFERLFASLQTLQFNKPEYFTAGFLEEKIKQITQKNKHQACARIRVTIFGDDKNFYEDEQRNFNYIIQSWQLNENVFQFNKNGLIAGIYKDAKKSCDAFSHIKTNNYLPYIMASVWAKQNKLNDAFLLNSYNRICDATIANIFIVKDGKIKTPALTEGCIAGIMRRFLIKCFIKENVLFEEAAVDIEELFNADEIFTTNAIRGIQWIKECSKKNYTNILTNWVSERFLSSVK